MNSPILYIHEISISSTDGVRIESFCAPEVGDGNEKFPMMALEYNGANYIKIDDLEKLLGMKAIL